MKLLSFLYYGIPVDIFTHRCLGRFFPCCPPVFIAYKKWCGATMIHIFGLRIRIGEFR